MEATASSIAKLCIFELGFSLLYSCDARSRIASCGARARSRTVEFSVQGVKSVWITFGVDNLLASRSSERVLFVTA